jgi:hypothetical protein
MPQSLGRGRAGSEPRYDMPRGMADNMRERNQRDTPAYDQAGTHPLFVPPGLAPQAVGASVTDGVAGPRHSALGLEGMEAEHQAAYGRYPESQSMKAPTVRKSSKTWYA